MSEQIVGNFKIVSTQVDNYKNTRVYWTKVEDGTYNIEVVCDFINNTEQNQDLTNITQDIVDNNVEIYENLNNGNAYTGGYSIARESVSRFGDLQNQAETEGVDPFSLYNIAKYGAGVFSSAYFIPLAKSYMPSVIPKVLADKAAAAIAGPFAGAVVIVVWNLYEDELRTAINNFEEKLLNDIDTLTSFVLGGEGTISLPNIILSNARNSLASIIDALRKDPLVLDLNNDGIKLTSVENSSVVFDMDGDGDTETTGWIKGDEAILDELGSPTGEVITNDDAFLVVDKNEDGVVNNVDELFGNDAETGFEELSKYDSNKDGVIDGLVA